MYEASADARNATAAAISDGNPSLARGIWPFNVSRWVSLRARVMSVSMKPGATTFAVMPRDPISRARDLVNPIIPALAAA